MLKTVSFAIVHFSVAFSVAWMISGSLLVGGAIALIEPMINTVAYYFHEKLWQSGGLFSSLREAAILRIQLTGGTQ
ncbi:MAG: DUF2061 domain-containing protein [Mariprofundaceae bacterium]|nr:DUF2061 domain-containing protein [Mariprofundaceae bacterium]